MGHALVQPLNSPRSRRAPALIGLLTTACSACSSTPKNEEPPPPPPIATPSNTFYVSPDGNDLGRGSAEDPFRNISRALTQPMVAKVVVAPGRYAEADLKIAIPVEIAGPGDNKAAIDGHLSIRGASVNFHGVDISGGLAIGPAQGVVIESSQIGGATLGDAVAIDHARVEMRDLKLSGGSEAVLHAVTSTVHLDRVTISAEAGKLTNRGLHAESSSVTARNLSASGMVISNIQVGPGGALHLLDSHSDGALSLGVAAIAGSSLQIDRSAIATYSDTAVLVSASSARLAQLTIGPSAGTGIGIVAADVLIQNPNIEICTRGAITLNNSTSRMSRLILEGGAIHHGKFMGLNVGGGLAIVRGGTRFTGDAKANCNNCDDAISAFGSDAQLRIESASSEAAVGFGVGIYSGATATISAVITHPRLGGVTIEANPGVPILVRGTVIDSCKTGSGLSVFDSTEVLLDNVQVRGCPEAGLLAGDNAVMRLVGSTLANNRRYGIGAFGASEVTVQSTAVSGSPQAVFASCADGSRVIDAGQNAFKGPVTTCP